MTEPLPTQRSLDALWPRVARVRLRGGSRGLDEDATLFAESVDPAGLPEALTISEAPGERCRCVASVVFDLLDRAGEKIARVELHHGEALAWARGSTHARLLDPPALYAWLRERGVPESALD